MNDDRLLSFGLRSSVKPIARIVSILAFLGIFFAPSYSTMLEMELPSSCTGSESDKERGGEELLLRPLCNGVLISVGADVDDKDGGGDTSLVVSWRNEVFLELLSKDFRFFKPPNLPFPFFTGAISVEGCCLFKSFSGEADSAPESQRSASTSLCFLVSSSASVFPSEGL